MLERSVRTDNVKTLQDVSIDTEQSEAIAKVAENSVVNAFKIDDEDVGGATRATLAAVGVFARVAENNLRSLGERVKKLESQKGKGGVIKPKDHNWVCETV